MAQTISIRERRKLNLDKAILSTRFLIFIGLAVFIALAYVHIKVEAIKLGYDISVNKKEQEKMSKENLLLQSEFMKLKSPARIEAVARELGFRFPTQEDVIYIKERTIVGERR